MFGSVRRKSDVISVTARIRRAKLAGKFVPLLFDVRNEAAAKRACSKVAKALGPARKLDFLIHNTGWLTRAPLLLESLADFAKHFEINVFGMVSVTRIFLPLMLLTAAAKRNAPETVSLLHGLSLLQPQKMVRNRGGRIVVVNSINGVFALPLQGGYCASKFALTGLAASWDLELQMYGLRVLSVFPGPIDTAMRKKVKGKDIERIRKSDYGSRMDTLVRNFIDHARNRAHPDIVAQKIYKACFARSPAPTYVATPKRFVYWWLPHILPARLTHWLLRVR